MEMDCVLDRTERIPAESAKKTDEYPFALLQTREPVVSINIYRMALIVRSIPKIIVYTILCLTFAGRAKVRSSARPPAGLEACRPGERSLAVSTAGCFRRHLLKCLRRIGYVP